LGASPPQKAPKRKFKKLLKVNKEQAFYFLFLDKVVILNHRLKTSYWNNLSLISWQFNESKF